MNNPVKARVYNNQRDCQGANINGHQQRYWDVDLWGRNDPQFILKLIGIRSDLYSQEQ